MKRILLLVFSIIITLVIKGQTFVVTEYTPPADFPQSRIEKGKRIIGQKVTLTFTDSDVRITAKDDNGEYKTLILQKKGNNIYRRDRIGDGENFDELVLTTFLGYIRECTFTHFHHRKFGASIKMKRQ